MRIYISIPISNDPNARQKADLVADKLSEEGHTPVNPFTIYAGKNPTYDDHICYDLRAMLDCDGIYFCKGWRNSCDCKIEHEAAINYILHDKKKFRIIYE